MTKGFCGVWDPQGYSGNPVDTFTIYVPYKVFNDDGPGAEEGSMTLNVPLTATEEDICEAMYQEIAAFCTGLSWPVPDRMNMYCYMPHPMVMSLFG